MAEALLRNSEGTTNRPFHSLGLDRFKFKDSAPGEDRVIDVEIGVFSGRGDQRDRPIFDEFKQRLLLFFIQILDLVEIEDHTTDPVDGVAPGDHLPDVRR